MSGGAAASPRSIALQSFESQWLAQGGLAANDPPQHDHGASPHAPGASSPHGGGLRASRDEAMRRLLRLGLPTTHDESWRYTSLRALAALDYAPADAPAAAAAGADSWLDPHARLPTLLIVNGHWLAGGAGGSQRQPPEAVGGAAVRRLCDLSAAQWQALAGRFGQFSDAEQHRWALLNAALFAGGLHLRIAARLEAPLLVLHVTRGDRPNTAAHPLLLIEAAAGAAATIIEHHIDPGGEAVATLCNSVTRIALDERAEIDHYRVFSTGAAAVHFDTLDVRLARDSRCRDYTLVLGGGLVRTTLEAGLDAAGSSLESHALLAGHESRHVDCVNVATHAAPDTRSTQTARAVASGASRVVINSLVRVEPGAGGSESRQSCRGLLLSPDAEIDSRPQLEIHADEVKCAHGATTGRLDPDMLFYLLSRGIDRSTAQSLLVFAFLADVLTGVPLAEARAAIENALIAQLPDCQLLRSFR